MTQPLTSFLTPFLTPLLAGALALAISGSAYAQEKVGPDRYQIVLHAGHPATPGEAKRMLWRIQDAAEAVCGAEESNLREYRFAVRRSACWRDSVAAAVNGTGDPLLAQAYRQTAKAKESA